MLVVDVAVVVAVVAIVMVLLMVTLLRFGLWLWLQWSVCCCCSYHTGVVRVWLSSWLWLMLLFLGRWWSRRSRVMQLLVLGACVGCLFNAVDDSCGCCVVVVPAGAVGLVTG